MSDWERVEAYLRRIAAHDGITEEHLAGMRDSGFEATAALTDEAVDSWRKFRKGDPLTAFDQRRLEAIVLGNGLRPSFDVKNGTFPDLPEPWDAMNSHRPFLDACIRGIGRVNVPGHPLLRYAGTGFIIGNDLLLTNRHVAEVFCETGGGQLTFTPGIAPALDLKQEVGSAESVIVAIVQPVVILTDWDAALLRVTGLPSGVVPLRLCAAEPSDPTGRLATLIGYPALDSQASTEEVLQQIQIFRAVFDKKRLQPGRLLGLRGVASYGRTVGALAHDCTTLGGNSGSAVIDVEAEAVVGLHFAGQYLVANYAVPSWQLAREPGLRDAGVVFA